MILLLKVFSLKLKFIYHMMCREPRHHAPALWCISGVLWNGGLYLFKKFPEEVLFPFCMCSSYDLWFGKCSSRRYRKIVDSASLQYLVWKRSKVQNTILFTIQSCHVHLSDKWWLHVSVLGRKSYRQTSQRVSFWIDEDILREKQRLYCTIRNVML